MQSQVATKPERMALLEEILEKGESPDKSASVLLLLLLPIESS